MIDLVCLVADKNLEAAIDGILRRPKAIGIREVQGELVVHPQRDPGCFHDSPHVERTLGWADENTTLRAALAAHDLWPDKHAKPPDPKAAVEWTLRKARKPRSSSIYRDLAGRVSFTGCQDRSFLRLKSLVTNWFGGTSRE